MMAPILVIYTAILRIRDVTKLLPCVTFLHFKSNAMCGFSDFQSNALQGSSHF